MRRAEVSLLLSILAAQPGCKTKGDKADRDAAPAVASDVRAPAVLDWKPARLVNRAAYIPSQCFTKTLSPGDAKANNPCYACHTTSESPNYTNDQDLQLKLSLPAVVAINPWTNLFDPPVTHVARATDEEMLAYVRRGNYFDDRGEIALERALDPPPHEWDRNDNGVWDGFRPDVWFDFDDRGFDHRPDGTLTGWRAFAYYPFPGTFFPTNGSADDVLVRLDPVLRENENGNYDRVVYELNLAIVEALATRADVPVDPVDERTIGVDLDLDGRLDMATHVAFDAAPDGSGKTRMRYVGRAHVNDAKGVFFPIAPGLFPLRTEFFHTVRYLDVGPDGSVTMAARMKEVRYAKKARWMTYESSRVNAIGEARQQAESRDGTHTVHPSGDSGIFERSWLLEGFIEAGDGSLRPQSFEETVFCEGCHGGIGATTDSVFSFARKIGGDAPARGWFHWSQHDLRGIPEPVRTDGEYEYTLYLREAGAGDELRENAEVVRRFFDDRHVLRPPEVERLHRDVSRLLLPSRARALDLDRAYRAIVLSQTFDKGRDTVLGPSQNVYSNVPIGAATGVRKAVVQRRLVLGAKPQR